MKNQNLLVDDNVESVKRRLETTLGNIKFQKGQVFWDDIEKLEHCIKALENIIYIDKYELFETVKDLDPREY
jgi:hypothetical protein